ncbi:ATP-binding protein [Desulfotomaculum sp. 1211_IL3151]|uniref:ATP-binding protein n=1 Tax=Desulfotomaculum sp. 1211_IL3151 TaxID=3084055 RepID=UPI002FD8F24D
MQDNVIIGVNILEILTTGMYRDSRVIFREYIQNSCDQIDIAVRNGLLTENEGQVELWINDINRSVCIEDNATGISASVFRKTLYSIGESSKTLGEDKGFRGIGHWCGLGYCKTLVFTSKAEGENVDSVMTCNAEKMRQMMDEHNSHKAHYTVDEVLAETVKFTQNKTKAIDKHYFKVELFEIRDVHTELCSLQQVKDYLSFVAPVGYSTVFRFRSTIHKHAEVVGQPIQEYNVSVNGEHILKKYTPSFTTSKGEDSITDVDFKDFRDDDGNLIAWLWFGISRFQGVLKKHNQMRGIRLRTQNIQIGSDDSLQKLFKEDRGQNYFIGEVFAIAKDLIPNSQRDYFNENKARLEFERLLSSFFNEDLSRIYKAGSNINSKYDKIEKAKQIKAEISTLLASGGDASNEQKAKLKRAERDAHNATQELAKIREKTEAKLDANEFGTVEVVVSEIIKANDEKRAKQPKQVTLPKTTYTPPKALPKAVSTSIVAEPPATSRKKEEKLVSMSEICKIIKRIADAPTAQAIITRIEEELL